MFTSFNSLSGTVGKFKYYTYFNYKEGDGWRPNSNFNSRNFFAHIEYELSNRTSIEGEVTFFNYLAKQPGGLTDSQFLADPTFSNRDRNWFDVDWKVYSLRLDHKFTPQTRASLQLFGLDAQRSALGFRTNRVSQPDISEEPRELLVDNFTNWGFEGRFLSGYTLFDKDAILLLGSKYYHATNNQQQGAGSNASDPDFTFATAQFPNYERQARFEFPNRNLAFFGENVINLNNKLTLTPGFRFEYIKTASAGSFKNILLDLAGNVILDEDVQDNRTFERDFFLFGLGLSYKPSSSWEFYANASQNYRSVTFSDIRIINPSFLVDENITDEEGYTLDLGMRGKLDDFLSYDVGLFGLRYDRRLGEVLFTDVDNSVKRRRGNIGDAFIYGAELFGDLSLKQLFFENSEEISLNFFANLAFTKSEYVNSEARGVEGNEVEFIPDINAKLGVNGGWKNVEIGLQYSYLGQQFSDASNAPQDVNDNQRGIEGSIPAYGVLDFSAGYAYKNWKLDAGITNVLNESYFTRRATGYPGPGIIPAEPRQFYTSLQFKW